MQKRLLRSLATDTHEQMSFDSTMSALGGARYGQSMLARAWLDRISMPACTDYIDDFIQASPAQAMVQTIVKNNNKKIAPPLNESTKTSWARGNHHFTYRFYRY